MELTINQELLDEINLYKEEKLLSNMMEYGLSTEAMLLIFQIINKQLDEWQDILDNQENI